MRESNGGDFMSLVVVDAGKHLGKIKPMHAVNNGPHHRKGMKKCQ